MECKWYKINCLGDEKGSSERLYLDAVDCFCKFIPEKKTRDMLRNHSQPSNLKMLLLEGNTYVLLRGPFNAIYISKLALQNFALPFGFYFFIKQFRGTFLKFCKKYFQGTSRRLSPLFLFKVHYINTGLIFWSANVDQIICWNQVAFSRILLTLSILVTA